MFKRALLVIAVLIAAVLLAVVARQYSGHSGTVTPATSSDTLFATSFPDAQGRLQSIGQWQGKIVVVNFWATWCPPCREEMPELSQLHEQYQSRNVVVLGIAAETQSQMLEFARSIRIAYPLLAGDMQAMELSASLGNDKSVLPYTVIIDPAGKIASTYVGRINKSLLEETIATLLPPSP